MIQFKFVFSSDFLPGLEEVVGETVSSMWWDSEGEVSGILPADQVEEFEKRLELFCASMHLPKPEIAFFPLEDKDWLAEDQQQLEPIHVGNFFIYPPHYSGLFPEDTTALKIDSPHAFGSGHHETTRTCLQVLQNLFPTLKVKKALDIGTGSGILAMAMQVLWNVPVFATDCDAKSVQESQSNFLSNGFEGISVVESFGLDHPEIVSKMPFELIVANIHSGPLIELAPAISDAKGGVVLLSGILLEQEQEVLDAYHRCGLSLLQRYPEGEWVTLTLK